MHPPIATHEGTQCPLPAWHTLLPAGRRAPFPGLIRTARNRLATIRRKTNPVGGKNQRNPRAARFLANLRPWREKRTRRRTWELRPSPCPALPKGAPAGAHLPCATRRIFASLPIVLGFYLRGRAASRLMAYALAPRFRLGAPAKPSAVPPQELSFRRACTERPAMPGRPWRRR